MSDKAPILRLSDVQVRIAGSHILQGIDLTVAEGGVTALLGRNGVGKTTTLKAILGLVPCTGVIEFNGGRIDGTATHRIVRSGVGYVPEDREIFGMLTVEENLKLAEVPGLQPDYDTVHELFPELHERRKQRAGTLSGGQQQMVALARVLLGPAKLLLVDEPTKGLAPKLVAEVGDVLARVAERTTVLLVEQNLPLVRRIANAAIVIDTGRVVHSSSAASLLADESLVNSLLGVAGADIVPKQHSVPAGDQTRHEFVDPDPRHRCRSRRAVFPGRLRIVLDLRADARAELRPRRLSDGRRVRGMGCHCLPFGAGRLVVPGRGTDRHGGWCADRRGRGVLPDPAAVSPAHRAGAGHGRARADGGGTVHRDLGSRPATVPPVRPGPPRRRPSAARPFPTIVSC